MRVLFTCLSAIDHFCSLVPIAQSPARAGHEVAFTATMAFEPQGEACGLRSFTAGAPVEDLQRALDTRGMTPLDQRDVLRRRLFPDVAPRRLLPELLALHDEWPPDLVVSSNYEFAGRVAAEHWGIPPRV